MVKENIFLGFIRIKFKNNIMINFGYYMIVLLFVLFYLLDGFFL